MVNANGYERILGYQKKNTFCAMDGLRNDEGVFVTVTTVVDSNVIPLDIDRIAGLMSGNRDFARDMLLYYSDVLKIMCLDAESQSSNSVPE